MFEDNEEWEIGMVEMEVPKTLEKTSYRLSIEVSLHDENRDHIFHLINNKLGTPILLFPQGMSKLLMESLPMAYKIYDANGNDVKKINDGTIFSAST
jgi:hypothetical protein